MLETSDDARRHFVIKKNFEFFGLSEFFFSMDEIVRERVTSSDQSHGRLCVQAKKWILPET